MTRDAPSQDRTGTLTPPDILHRPTAPRYQDRHRLWQGIPSIEATSGGRLYANWYTGMDTETGGNFVVVTTSDDAGDTWSGPRWIVEHPDPEVRVYDPCLWRDPRGRLWLTWNQSRDFYDGRVGFWAAICDDPDTDEPTWGAPRRLGNGLMMNKPTVLANGEWLFPSALWACHPPTESHGLEHEMTSNVYVSTDEGATVALRGGADVPNRSFDEHMVVERRDGSLWMLVRCFDGIGESFSTDGGRTWSPGRRSHIDGPCSRFHIRRQPSGRLLMVNHDGFGDRSDRADIERQGNVKAWKGRSRLTALLSEDDGATWPFSLLLDERDDVSYPDVAVRDDGTIVAIYDHDRFGDRAIYAARFTEDDVLAGELGAGGALRLLVNRALAEPEPAGAQPSQGRTPCEGARPMTMTDAPGTGVAGTDPVGRAELVTLGETMACLSSAEPRPLRFAAQLALSIGGAESNVAIAAARLGVSSAWMGRLGRDELGALIIARLRAEGVHVHAAEDAERPTGLMLKSRRTSSRTRVDYYRRGNAGSHLGPADLDPTLIRQARVLHVSGITPALGPSARDACRLAVDLAADAGVPVSVDLNHRRTLWSDEAAGAEFRRMIARADVVFATVDEARVAVPTATAEHAAEALLSLGAGRVVLKHGFAGASSHDGVNDLMVPAFDAVAIDEVGAGDAFAAGYLAALLRDQPELERLRWGAALGAFAVSTVGDWEGAPTAAELAARLAEDVGAEAVYR